MKSGKFSAARAHLLPFSKLAYMASNHRREGLTSTCTPSKCGGLKSGNAEHIACERLHTAHREIGESPQHLADLLTPHLLQPPHSLIIKQLLYEHLQWQSTKVTGSFHILHFHGRQQM